MSGIIGAQIPELEHLQVSFQRQSAAVSDLMTALSSDVEATWWQGGAADRFRTAWESDFRPALVRLEEALKEAGDEVGRRAQALIQVGS